ncbi:MAG: ABC transporter permease [Methanobrevibacter sp.]|uniref:ABC transporter permease n=1 Tax=Methanobrevibacter sp. TaxID=66852 RepID=UPI0025D9DBCA|nr:ABC transporter permease [Methanobrevibacter sp.]MBR3114047.1 ABC transporter permease [Methanobrevibacter sp.]MBR6994163.1 ABC transporter permease [Methanobrevibacter sp.]
MNILNTNHLFLLHELVKKNFSSKYKDSSLGILWSLLRPLLIMMVFTIVFSTVFGRTIKNYPVYYLVGRTVLDFFNGSITSSMNALRGNRNILIQTAAPKHIFVLASVITEFLNYLISLILVVGVMIATHAPFYFNTIPYMIIPVISLIMMTTGFSLILSILAVYYSDIIHLWGVVSLLILYTSAIFYPMDIISEPFRSYAILSPVFWIIDQVRDYVYLGTMHSVSNTINSMLLSIIILLFGIIVFRAYRDRVSKRF